MSVFKRFRNLFRKQAFKSLPPEQRSLIKEIFILDGVKYYTFEDIFRMPTLRGLQALDYYDEFSMRCTKEYLTYFCKACETILSDTKKLELIKLATLVKELNERLNMIPLPEHVYKLASVMFFDETENPYFYDRDYAAKKIAKWKENPGVLDFFLQQPLRDLIPYLNMDGASLHTYSVASKAITEVHRKTVSEILSLKGTTIDM